MSTQRTAKPILFIGPMIRALLDGRKTQTRRTLHSVTKRSSLHEAFSTRYRPSPLLKQINGKPDWCVEFISIEHGLWDPETNPNGRSAWYVKIPWGGPGDLLWCRETWAVGNIYDDRAPRDINPDGKPGWCGIRYAATDHRLGIKDRPSIHMPRWASRLTLEVTGVKIERVQDISEEDALAEGVENDSDGWRDYAMPHTQCCASARDSFCTLWDSINAKRGFGWDANPWVTCLTFTVHQTNIDALLERLSSEVVA